MALSAVVGLASLPVDFVLAQVNTARAISRLNDMLLYNDSSMTASAAFLSGPSTDSIVYTCIRLRACTSLLLRTPMSPEADAHCDAVWMQLHINCALRSLRALRWCQYLQRHGAPPSHDGYVLKILVHSRQRYEFSLVHAFLDESYSIVRSRGTTMLKAPT